ncbi:MAG: SRPBCC family protein [Actinomycetota bacterium]|nr:SRPBCC family protein [Actinomycetota bacterium]
MTVIRNSVVIRCTPEEAFDYLSDHRAELDWNPKCRVMEKITDGPVGLGTRYRAKWKGSPYVELETVHFKRPRTWTMHNGGPIEVTFTGTLEPVPGGTELHAEFRPQPHGWFRLIFPLFLPIIRRDERANMGHIREALERRLQAQTPP